MDPLTAAIARFDWDACRALLEGVADDAAEARYERLEQRVRESGRLLLQRPSVERARQRDTFVEHATAFLEGQDETQAAFVRHVDGIRIIETGFHTILDEVRVGPQAHLAPDVHVWSLIARLASEDALMQADMHATLRREPFVFDPQNMHLVNERGDAYRPDAVNGAVIEVFSSTLLMLGHQNGWFRPDGALELPNSVDLPDQATFRAGLTVALGQGWRLLDHAAERWRFFGGTVSKRPFEYQSESGEQRQVEAIWFENEPDDGALTWDLLDTIAHERLTRLFTQVHMMLQAADIPAVRDDATELAPAHYVSVLEAYTVVALCHALHFNVARDQTTYAGLLLREWVRGYAVLVREAEEAPPDGPATLSWTLDELVALFRGAGLSEPSARAFVDLVTFGREHGDLLDAPLLRTQDGRLHCLPHLVRVANVPRLVLSHLSELSVQIERRGPALEEDLKRVLREQNFRCEGLHFWHEQEEYECDAAMVWERTLFLFECKNRSLSAGRPSRRHRFVHDVIEATEQLERLEEGVTARPEIVRAALGDGVEWDRIVRCVVNGLPFSIPGDEDGSYVADMSALSRFFQEPTINVQSPRLDADGRITIVTRPIRRVWAGARPTVADFLESLKAPVQVMGVLEDFHALQHEWPLGRDLAIVLSLIRVVPRSFEASLRALGENDPERVLEDIRNHGRELRGGPGDDGG